MGVVRALWGIIIVKGVYVAAVIAKALDGSGKWPSSLY